MNTRQGATYCRPRFGAAVLVLAALPLAAQGYVEVAAIREDRTNQEFPLLRMDFHPGRLEVAHLRVEDLVAFAFGVRSSLRDRLMTGWPATGIKDKRFDISAKLLSADTLKVDEQRSVMRELLTTRFGLKAHIEQRTMDVYRVRLAKPGVLGPGLAQVAVNCSAVPPQQRPKDKNGRAICRGTEYDPHKGLVRVGGWGNIQQLMQVLESYSGYGGDAPRRVVIDATGLQGWLAWSFPPPKGDLGILREHLGLMFEPGKAPVNIVVIDDVRMPTPN